jgi:hypothetical protein
MAHYRIIGNAWGYPWVIYVPVCSDVINEHERVWREHAYCPHDLQAGLYGRAATTLNYGTGDPGSIPGTVIFIFVFNFFWYPMGSGVWGN